MDAEDAGTQEVPQLPTVAPTVETVKSFWHKAALVCIRSVSWFPILEGIIALWLDTRLTNLEYRRLHHDDASR